MKPAAAIFTATLFLGALTKPASGQLFLEMLTGRDYMQRGPYLIDFRGGQLYIGLQDGSVTLSPCADHPSPVPVPPNIFCPLGTNGFIANGDVDNDGVRDGLFFWSFAEVVPALIVEPLRAELCLLQDAPYSKLPRPIGTFQDRSVVTFFDVFTASVLQYDVSVYEFTRDYAAGGGGWTQMRDEIVYGTYRFTFPQLNFPERRVPLAVTYSPIPEAVGNNPNPSGQKEGFRFTSGRWTSDGYYMMDPRLLTSITWDGIDATNLSPGSDTVRLAIFNTAEDTILFPPSGTYLTLPNPYEGEYLLPSYFFDIGDEALFRLRVDRNRGTTTVAFDTSARLFNFNIRFMDSYQGFRIGATGAVPNFPRDAAPTQTLGNADFDGDGQTNLYEFALQSNPNNAGSTAADPVAVTNGDGTVSFTLTKRAFAAVTYKFQVSELGGPFRTIGTNDATWEITTDDDTTLTITTRDPAMAADFTARILVTELDLR